VINVSYVTTGNDNIASFRYRILAPAQNLGNHLIFPNIGNQATKEARIVIFSKHWTYNDWSYAKFCKLRGQKVIFDVCDDHFEDSMSDHYRRMSDVADTITCNSHEMAKIIKEKVGKNAVVIADPVLSPRMQYDPTKKISLVWYGQSMNIQGLYDVYTKDCTTPLEVVLPCSINPPEHFNNDWVSSSNWNKDIIPQVAERHNVALLPYRQGKDAKSANRVLEALQCGMLVLTDPIPSVLELPKAGIRYLNAPLNEIIEALSNWNYEVELKEAQDFIDNNYTPEVITEKWVQVFQELA
jgi:hypothetical protein